MSYENFEKNIIFLKSHEKLIGNFKLKYSENLIVIDFKDKDNRLRMNIQYGFVLTGLYYDYGFTRRLIKDFEGLTLFLAILQAFLKNQIATKEEISLNDELLLLENTIRRAEYSKQQVLEIISYDHEFNKGKPPVYSKDVIGTINKIEAQRLVIYLNKFLSKALF
jgi:hypothetical protein